MHVSVSRFFTIAIGAISLGASSHPAVLGRIRPDVRPTRRTVLAIQDRLFRSRYTGAALRRLAADPYRQECRRRRARAAALAAA